MAFNVGGKKFERGTHVMGILNLSNLSFFAPSRTNADDIVDRARRMADDGAEIIDVGAQSTAPKAPFFSELEESSLLLPALEVLLSEKDLPPISVDTFYPNLAKTALELGADMINDVTGLTDSDMARVIADADASVCIMHNRRKSKMADMWLDKETGLSLAVDKALKAGINPEKIILDGGVGFNKSTAEDRTLADNYGQLSVLGYPLLLGTSRKSFLGAEDGRLTATLETTKRAVEQGILFVRVHDVKENLAVIKAYER